MEGCEGSSFVFKALQMLLPCAAGWNVLNGPVSKDMHLPYVHPFPEKECFKAWKFMRAGGTHASWLEYVKYFSLNSTTLSWKGPSAAEWRVVFAKMRSDALAARASLLINSDFHSGSMMAMEAGHDFFAETQMPFVHVRRNVLDHLVCLVRDCGASCFVRDCFNEPGKAHGLLAKRNAYLPLAETCEHGEAGCEHPRCEGKRSALCFARRSSAADLCPTGYKAFLESKTLPARLASFESRAAEDGKRLEPFLSFGSRRIFSYERLASFQYPAEASGQEHTFNSSVAEWHTLLLALGAAHASHADVAGCLRGSRGSRSSPSPHADVIHNEAEVRDVLCSPGMAPRFGRFLRPPCATTATPTVGTAVRPER